MSTLREQILAKRQAPPLETVRIPGVDGPVGLRVLTLGERLDFLARYANGAGSRVFSAELFAVTAVDADGNRLFQLEDAPAIAEVFGPDLDKAIEVAVRVNGLNSDAVDQAAKN